jgi:alpha-amylase
MPGVPCVFWPHWYKYKSEIKAMITARRRAGIHSESSVQETSGNGYYEATITGKYGNVIVYLGSSANKAAPQGYTQAVKGGKYAMY